MFSRVGLGSVCVFSLLALSGTALAEDPPALPEGFPVQETLKAEAGQLALGIDPYRLKDMKEKKNAMVSYTNFEIIEVGSKQSKVKRVSEAVLPNSLILPLPRGEKVEVGDVVFTWWQSGGGIQHAIVTGGTPRTPMVRYLTLPDSIKASKEEHTLKPESFIKLDTPYEHGSTVMFPVHGNYNLGTVLNSSGDKLLIFASARLHVVDKSRTEPVPAVPGKLKKGKVVYVPRYGKMGPAKVLKVDKETGKVTVELQFASKDKQVIPYTQIAESLP